MAEVIHLTEVKKGSLATKTETHKIGKHTYTCKYDPHAPPGKQWVWWVDYVQTFRYAGSAPSYGTAVTAARKLIHKMDNRED